jgi:hypothetical protein
MANSALCRQLAQRMLERAADMEHGTGFRPVAWKTMVQLEDDSVLELRVEPSPGLHAAQLTTVVFPQLRSGPWERLRTTLTAGP